MQTILLATDALFASIVPRGANAKGSAVARAALSWLAAKNYDE